MFSDISAFARSLLSRTHSVALISWENHRALAAFIHALGPAIREQKKDTVITQTACGNLDSETFAMTLISSFRKRDASRRLLLLYEIEPLVGAVGRVLNGFRERLSLFRAVIVAVREDRRRDLLIECPDLIDWIGLSVARAEDFGPAFTLRDIRASVKEFEQRYGISSKAFMEQWDTGHADTIGESWLWKELIAIQRELEAQSRKKGQAT